MSTMASLQHDVMELLTQHHLTPDLLLLQLETTPLIIIESEDQSWSFVMRRQCRRYLMAKHNQMKQYREIYSAAH
jgi:hypothetical protein